MRINTHLDVDVVAVEQEDTVSVMLELVAPPAPAGGPRLPATVQLVLDRSGSMAGERLDAAKAAIVALVDRLAPEDQLGLVAFDDAVQVVLPAGRLTHKAAAKAAVRSIEPGGMTDLSGGLLRGLQEARRVAGDGGATVILLSDGLANVGETDPDRLRDVAAGARDRGVTTSTIGIGLGYDETILAELAGGGQGNHAFAETGDAAAAVLAGEVDGLLSKTVQASSLMITMDTPVESVTVWNDLPCQPVDGGLMVELGDLYADETRKVLLSFAVPAKTGLGLAQVAELTLRHVALPSLKEQTVTLPVHVNVVPGDQAAGRIPDPVVRTELAYQQVQDAKKRASEALRDGDHDTAAALFEDAGQALNSMPAPYMTSELVDEAQILQDLQLHVSRGDALRAAKLGRAEHARKNRRRGR